MTHRDAGYREGIEAELLPCPFCGNKNIRVCSNGIGDFYAICTGEDDEPHCGASCSEVNCETEAKAVRRWNTRALPLPSTPDDGKAEPTKAQVNSACLSYRHDFSLLAPDTQGDLQRQAKEWLGAWQKEGFCCSPASDGAIREALKLAVSALDHVGLTYPDDPFIERVLKEIEALSAHAGGVADCPDCDGSGYRTISEAGCCGNPTRTGECCGNAIEVPGTEKCSTCGGSGKLPGPPDTHAEVKG